MKPQTICAIWSAAVSGAPMPRRARMRGGAVDLLRSTERFECRAQVRHEKLRLFPRREMAGLFVLLVIDELWIRPLCPTLRGLIELVRKRAHGGRDGDVLWGKEGELAFPVQA